MRLIKWLFSIILILILAVVSAGYVFLRNFDLNRYKDLAAKVVYEQTGRQLVIGGNAELGISLVPTLIINDVSLSNPSWAQNPQMLKLDSLELQLAILPLLKKQIAINKVLLNRPQIYLEVAKDGKTSWDFAPLHPKTAASVPASGGWLIASANAAELPSTSAGISDYVSDIIIRQVEIGDGTISFYDAAAAQTHNLHIDAINLQSEGLDAPLNFSWNVDYNQMPISGRGTAGALGGLLNNSPNYPLNLEVKALGLSLRLDAKLNKITTDPAAEFDLQLQNPAGNLSAPALQLSASGKADRQKINLDIRSLNAAGNVITGKVAAKLNEKLPFVEAVLQSNLLNLQSLTVPQKNAWVWPQLISSANAGQLVPAEPIPFELLKIVNAKAAITIKKLQLNPAVTAENVKLNAKLNNGLLEVSPLVLNFGSGKLEGSIKANAAAQSLTLRLNGKEIPLTAVHREFAITGANDFGFVSGGKLTLAVDLEGRGDNFRSLVNSLQGQAVAFVGKSEVQSGKLQFLTDSFITRLLGLLKIDTKNSDKVDLQCAVVRTDVKNGKAVFPHGIAIDSNRLTLTSDGKINLVNDNIDFNLNAYRNNTSDLGIMQALSGLIRVSGSLQNPSLSIDKTGAVKTIAGVMAGGPAALGADLLLDRDAAPCHTALQNTAFSAVFPKASGVSGAAQNTYRGTTEAVKNSVKDLKNNAKELLKLLK